MKSKHNRERQQDTAGSESNHPSAPSADSETEHHRPHSRNAKRESENNEDDAQNRQFRKINMILMLVFTGALVLVNIIYAYFAGGQWTAMGDSLKETRINRELEYRAYVAAKEVTLRPRKDNPAFVDVLITSINTGRTPVSGAVQITKKIEPRDDSPPDDTVITAQGPSSKVAYIPNVEYSTYIGVLPTGEFDKLAKKAEAVANSEPTPTPPPIKEPSPTPVAPTLRVPEMPQFGNGWYVYGTIAYSDIFGKPHQTKFCFFARSGTAVFFSCPTFNDAN